MRASVPDEELWQMVKLVIKATGLMTNVTEMAQCYMQDKMAMYVSLHIQVDFKVMNAAVKVSCDMQMVAHTMALGHAI